MTRSLLLLAASTLLAVDLSAQWVGGGLFSVFNHFQAAAFQSPDTGLFVYGSDNPMSGEGGIIRTNDGAAGGGFYIWYRPNTILEDIDVQWSNGVPYYLAAGSKQYGTSIIVRQYDVAQNVFAFDSVQTGFSQYYRAVRMRSDLVAFAAGGNYLGDGIIDMSLDTGFTWSPVTVLPGQPVSRLHFVDDQLGFASTGGYRRMNNNGIMLPDSGAIYRTQDGGLTWQQVHSDGSNGFAAVAFSNPMNGVATRNDGAVLRTTDGGTTWSLATVNMPPPFVLTSAHFRPDGTGFIGGYRTDGSEGFILISANGGATWDLNFSSATLNHSRRVYDITFPDDFRGYAATHIKPLRTTGLITGIEEQDQGPDLLFPNPATDRTRITWQAPFTGTVELIDAKGVGLQEHRVRDRTYLDLDISGMDAGLYLVRYQGQEHKGALRLMRP